MQIGFDAKRAFNNVTGLGNYSRRVVENLLHFYPEEHYHLFTPKSDAEIEKFWAEVLRQKNVHTHKPNNIFYQTLHPIWRSYGTTQIVQNKKLDVFHGLSNELPLGIEHTEIRRLVTIHDLIFLRYPQFFSLTDRTTYKRKFERACQISHLVVATSHQTKEDIVNYFDISPDKIFVVYQNCNEIFYQNYTSAQTEEVLKIYGIPEEYILLVSKTDRRKNHLTFLKAYKQVYDSNSSLPPLVLCGGAGDQHRSVIRYIHQNKLPVISLEYVKHEHLPILYDACMFSVYPSLFEGFGIPLVEAMARKKASLTSSGSCFEEIAADTALYANPEKPDEMAEQLEKLATDSVLRKNLEKNGSGQLRNFDVETNTHRLHQLYKGAW